MPLSEYTEAFPRLCRRLLQTTVRGRLGQSYLFVGDDPNFLEGFVRAWLQVCVCKQRTPAGDACGECKDCRAMATGSYPELFQVRPVSKSRQIRVEDMHGLEHSLGLTSGLGRLRFGLIFEADRMNEVAQNTFLKTLEEPPSGTLLALLTTQPRALLPTIRSRCQTVSLLRNRRAYDFPAECGLFPLLGRLRPRAGSTVALAVSAQFRELLGRLRQEAEDRVGTVHDERWAVVAGGDPTLRKRLDEERKARVEAEYVRLRDLLLEAVDTWFQQMLLAASGVTAGELPHPEILESAGVSADVLATVPWDSAEKNCQQVAELLRDLNSNVHERLAVDAFCLAVCAKGL